MSRPIVKFSKVNDPEFFVELRKRVNFYFESKKISKLANAEMKIKTVFMLVLYFLPFALMLTNTVSGVWMVLLMWAFMGLGMSGIGLSIMHDANHGAYSKHKWINSTLGFLINFLGAYDANWKIQHNVLHHSFTNIDEMDGDIMNPVMRFSPDQAQKKAFKYQAYYAPFLYSIMTLYWFISKDYQRIYSYNKKDLLRSQKLTLSKALLISSFHKVWYIVLTLVLPMLIVNVPWWQSLLGFLLMHGITGLVLALIFQPAHVITETNFYQKSKSGTVENNWAVHQMKTTANFANNAKIFSWFIGGLNHQIEHHLFPKICHVHYKHISGIVKSTALEYGIPYHQHNTFYGAVKSHFTLLNQLGTGQYDVNLALKKVKV